MYNTLTKQAVLQSDRMKALKMLEPYQHLNFVDRILNKDKYPVLDLGKGNYATHKMAYATDDDGAVLYPTVIQPTEGADLMDLGPDAGYEHARATNNFIRLSPEDAAWLSKNYKSIWGK
jgi:hypothetical protein